MATTQSREDVRHAPWERRFGRILTPFEEFLHQESASSLVLMACTVAALVLANSPLADAYTAVLHTRFGLTLGGWSLELSLHHWINDGLMASFFFVVGLEIKREVLVGDLANPRAAALPIIAAAGGMVAPALLYGWFNAGTPAAHGWGIPMATDIAFAVGVLALLGDRVPKSLATFLVALAIVDDLGAVAVIALFYTDQIVPGALGLALACVGILITMNLAGVRHPIPYLLVTIPLWFAMQQSGIHATITGVLAAWAVPNRPKLDPRRFSEYAHQLLDRFDALDEGESTLICNNQRRAVVQAVESGVRQVESPLQRLEHMMHMPVAFFVIPVFALTNAGVPLNFSELSSVFSHPVSLGIIVSLIAGKLLGVAGVSLLAVKLGIGQYPAGCGPRHLFGVGLLAGIGFTMSIFVAELAFTSDASLLVSAKTGVLFASLLAGVGGYLWLRVCGRTTGRHAPARHGLT